MSKISLKSRVPIGSMSTGHQKKKRNLEDIKERKPFDFCCDYDDYDSLSKYDQRNAPFEISWTSLHSNHGCPLLKIRSRITEPIPKGKGYKNKTGLTTDPSQWITKNNTTSSVPGALTTFIEDELDFARSLNIQEIRDAFEEEKKEALLIAKKRNCTQTINEKSNIPHWYQDFSNAQMEHLMKLKGALCADHEENTTNKTQKVLLDIGILSPSFNLNSRTIRILQQKSQLHILTFLRGLYKTLTGVDFINEEYKNEYNCNERLILSAIAFLTLPKILVELNKKLPPVKIPKYPAKPTLNPPPYPKKEDSPYKENLFQKANVKLHQFELYKWRKDCARIPKPKIILPLEFGITALEDFNERKNKESDEDIDPQNEKHNNLEEVSNPKNNQEKKNQSPECFSQENLENTEKINDKIHLSKFEQRTPRIDKQRFDFTLSGRLIQDSLKNDPRFWYEGREPDIKSDRARIPAENYPEFKSTEAIKVTSRNSNEEFFQRLKFENKPRKTFPQGREFLSKHWQEWLQNVDEDLIKIGREADKLIESVETTMKLVLPKSICDTCCACRQTRKFDLEKHSIKTPYIVVESVAEDGNDKRYIVGSISMQSPAPSLTEFDVNFPGDIEHSVEREMQKNRARTIKNVPPCSCSMKKISSGDSDKKVNDDIIINLQGDSDDSCIGVQYRPRDVPAYSCGKNSLYILLEKMKKINEKNLEACPNKELLTNTIGDNEEEKADEQFMEPCKSVSRESLRKNTMRNKEGTRNNDRRMYQKIKNGTSEDKDRKRIFDLRKCDQANNRDSKRKTSHKRTINGGKSPGECVNSRFHNIARKLKKQNFTKKSTHEDVKEERTTRKPIKRFSKSGKLAKSLKEKNSVKPSSTTKYRNKINSQRVKSDKLINPMKVETEISTKLFMSKVLNKNKNRLERLAILKKQQVNQRDVKEIIELSKISKIKPGSMSPSVSKGKLISQEGIRGSKMLEKLKMNPEIQPKDNPDIQKPVLKESRECAPETSEGGPFGWKTESEERLKPQKTLIYLTDPIYSLKTVPVKPGGRACHCRRNRNKKKVLKYNIGGLTNKSDRRKKGMPITTQVIEGLTHITPPPSPRRSDEYIPEYELYESPYEMCTRKKTDEISKLTKRFIGVPSLNRPETIGSCDCSNKNPENGYYPDNKITSELNEEDFSPEAARKEWNNALKDIGLRDFLAGCEDNVPCWLQCSKYSKSDCCNTRKLQVVKPVCECKYERKIVERNEERKKWSERQERLKSYEKKSFTHIVGISGPIGSDDRSITPSEGDRVDVQSRVVKEDKNDDPRYCENEIGKNHDMASVKYLIDRVTMQTPLVTPKSSEKIAPCVCAHKHWSVTHLPENLQNKVEDELHQVQDNTRRNQKRDDPEECREAPNMKPYNFNVKEDRSINQEIEFSRKRKKKEKKFKDQKIAEGALSDNTPRSDRGRIVKLSGVINTLESDQIEEFGDDLKRKKIEREMGKTLIRELNEDTIEGSGKLRKYTRKTNMEKIVRVELEEMSSRGFLFAKLPDCHLMPQLKYWLQYRRGSVLTDKKKKKLMMATSESWNKFKKHSGDRGIRIPSKNLEEMTFNNLTFERALELKDKIAKKKATFFNQVRQNRVTEYAFLWQTMEFGHFPVNSFKEAFFTYLPAKEVDGHLLEPPV